MPMTDAEKSLVNAVALATAQSYEIVAAMVKAVELFSSNAALISLGDLQAIGQLSLNDLSDLSNMKPFVRRSARRMRARELVALYRGNNESIPAKWPQSALPIRKPNERRLSLAGLTRQEIEARLARRG